MKIKLIFLLVLVSFYINAQEYIYQRVKSDTLKNITYSLFVDSDKGVSYWENKNKDYFYNTENYSLYMDKVFKKRYLVKDSIEVKWNVIDSTFEYKNFNAKIATTNFRDRKYTAIFTEEVPMKYGPWKFHGLNGLILYVQSEDEKIIFEFKNILDNSFKENDLKKPKLKEVSFENYKALFYKNYDNYMKLLTSDEPPEYKKTNNFEYDKKDFIYKGVY